MIQAVDRKTMVNLALTNPDVAEEGLEQLFACANLSQHLFVGMINDKLICFYGLAPPCLLADKAYLWLYVTPNLKEHVFTFVRHSQMVIEEMLKVYPIIEGHAAVGNSKAIRWLKWLGAEFFEPVGHKIPFWIRKKTNG